VLDAAMPELGQGATGERLLARFPNLPGFIIAYSRDRDERTAR